MSAKGGDAACAGREGGAPTQQLPRVSRCPGAHHQPVGFSLIRKSLVRSPPLPWERENRLESRLDIQRRQKTALLLLLSLLLLPSSFFRSHLPEAELDSHPPSVPCPTAEGTYLENDHRSTCQASTILPFDHKSIQINICHPPQPFGLSAEIVLLSPVYFIPSPTPSLLSPALGAVTQLQFPTPDQRAGEAANPLALSGYH